MIDKHSRLGRVSQCAEKLGQQRQERVRFAVVYTAVRDDKHVWLNLLQTLNDTIHAEVRRRRREDGAEGSAGKSTRYRENLRSSKDSRDRLDSVPAPVRDSVALLHAGRLHRLLHA